MHQNGLGQTVDRVSGAIGAGMFRLVLVG